ncbi:MAG: sulfotransferase family 2 domain-containing protein [Pseudomonadota bacterium]
MPVFVNEAGRRVFYAHVPKTGGTYVEDLFRRNGYAVHFWESRPRSLALVCSPQHFHRPLYEAIFRMGGFDLAFMTVRSPLERMLSEYRNQCASRPQGMKDWLVKIGRALERDGSAFDNHLRPQVDFFHPGLAVHRQEDGFDADWAQRLSAEHDLGFSVFEVPRRRNTSATPSPLAPADRALSAAHCTKVYAQDYAFFGYDDA